MMKKKALAYWGVVCPGCNMGRRFPNSFIGKKVVQHWEQGCPVREAYKEVFGQEEAGENKNSEKSEKS